MNEFEKLKSNTKQFTKEEAIDFAASDKVNSMYFNVIQNLLYGR